MSGKSYLLCGDCPEATDADVTTRVDVLQGVH
jgi:hypothetical protein